jgi:hypothetical protein
MSDWWVQFWPFGVPSPRREEAETIVRFTLYARQKQRAWKRYSKKRRST